MEKSIDTVYTEMSRIVFSSVLGEVLVDLNDLYREGCNEERSESDEKRRSDSGFEKMLESIGMKIWGPTDDFENLVLNLIKRYENQIRAIVEGKDLKVLDSDSRRRVKELDIKCSLIQAAFRASTSIRINRYPGEPSVSKKLAVIPYKGNIYTGEIVNQEEFVRALGDSFEEKDAKKDEIIPGYC